MKYFEQKLQSPSSESAFIAALFQLIAIFRHQKGSLEETYGTLLSQIIFPLLKATQQQLTKIVCYHFFAEVYSATPSNIIEELTFMLGESL